MNWKMVGKPISTADVAGVPAVFQGFTPANNMLLRGAVVGLIIHNNPAFTSVALKLYANRSLAPSKLIATSSNSWLKAQVLEDTNNLAAYKQLGFSFDYLPLQGGIAYHLAVVPAGYTGDSSSHIAWRYSFPDPQYREGITLATSKATDHHFEMSIIGKELD